MKVFRNIPIPATVIIFSIYIHIGEITSNDLTNGEEFYSYFIREAPLHPGDYQSNISIEDIPWVDVNLLEKAARHYKHHFPGIAISMMYGLLEVFSIKSTASILLATKRFSNYTLAYTRLLETVDNVMLWCESGVNILDPLSDAFKSLEMVRRRHRSASYTFTKGNFNEVFKNPISFGNIEYYKILAQAIRDDLAHIDTSDAPMHLLQWNSTAPVGQFDLGVVQFLFYCHSTINPAGFAVLRSSNEDRRAFVHLWAVLGRILGIQDRFNVALNLPFNMYSHFYRNIVVASLKNIDEIVISLMVNTLDGGYANFLIPSIMKFKCWLFYALNASVEGFEGKNIRRLMELEDNVCLFYLSFAVFSINTSKAYSAISVFTFQSWYENEIERLGIRQ